VESWGKNGLSMNHVSIEALTGLLQSPIFLSAIFSWLIAQTLKSIIEIFRNRPNSAKVIILHFLWATGGMPSSHSAVVSALASSIGFVLGINSPLFILSLFIAFIIIRDALGVRRAAGSQAVVLNQLIRDLSDKLDIKSKTVKEIHGHKLSEVTMGLLLGFFIAAAFCTL
jgi:acid phosphatase family membrane protein YuiD